MTDLSKVLDKIKKCFALANSSNEHEAAAALRQARKLMEANGLTDQDVMAANAQERSFAAGAKETPARWEAALVHVIGKAFACEVIFSALRYAPGEWRFIGCGAAPEIAQYACSVLLRQLRRTRADYIANRLKRCKPATKTRRADLFCEGWVSTVSATVADFAQSDVQSEAVTAYMLKHYPSLTSLMTRDRNEQRRLGAHEVSDYCAGASEGRNARISHGLGNADARPEIEGTR